jgi:hypothetical protein
MLDRSQGSWGWGLIVDSCISGDEHIIDVSIITPSSSLKFKIEYAP